MNYIIISKYGRPTIREIVKQMKEPVNIIKQRDQDIPICPTVFNSNDTVISHGNTYQIITTNLPNQINTPHSNYRAINKALARVIMRQSQVRTPVTYDMPSEINNNYPVIARPRFHSKGKNFIVLNNYQELINFLSSRTYFEHGSYWYYSKLIDKTNEYRVHVAHGKILSINEKTLLLGEVRGNKAITKLPWGKSIGWDDYDVTMCKLACDAVDCLELHYGAVDIIKGVDGTFYVCEVNTAPTINENEYMVQKYAKYFDWILRNPDAEKWPYKNYTQGKSFAWKPVHFGE